MGVSNPEAFKQINELLFEIHDLFDLTKLTTWSDHKVFARKIRHYCRKLIALNSWNITKTCSMESICKDSHFTPTSRAGRILEREYETREKSDRKSMVDFFAMVRFQGRLGDWWETYHLIETLQHFIEAKRDIHEPEFLNEFRNLVGIFMLLKHELTPTKEDQHDESTMLWKWTLYNDMTFKSEGDREAAFRNMSQEKLAYEVSKLNDAEWARDREYYAKIGIGRVDPVFGNADLIGAKIDIVSKLAKCDKKQATIALKMCNDDVDKAIAYVDKAKSTTDCDKEWKMSKPAIKSESTSIPGNNAAIPSNVTSIGSNCAAAPTDSVAIMGDGSFSLKPKANKKRKVKK